MAYQKKEWKRPEPLSRIPFKPSYPPSDEQAEIFRAAKEQDDNIHVEASPGSGKSTTLKWLMAQQAVDRFGEKAAMLAFSKAIVTEIEPQCAPNVTVKTAHSFGYGAIASRFGKLNLVNGKVSNIYEELFPERHPSNVGAKEKGKAYAYMFDFISLVDKLRVNLADENDPSKVMDIADQYNIEIDEEMISLLPPVFDRMVENPNAIDFTDMIWLPIRLGLAIPKFDMVYVDERQDLNNVMIEYVHRMTGDRVVTVGDKNQSIFNFGGADPQATERLIGQLGGIELPLNTCYRCGTDIVAKARTIYDKILPFEHNHKGVVEHRDEIDYDMPEGSMILSRKNVNLIRPCFELLKRGRKAIIKGKDIGAGLVRLIDQLKPKDIFDLVDKVTEHQAERVEKLSSSKKPMLAQIEAVIDQCQCIIYIANASATVDELKFKINNLFDEATKGVVLSSIHRSKGLEAKQVSILDYSNVRMFNEKMTEADRIQEKNLEFVAVTRAMDVLHLIR